MQHKCITKNGDSSRFGGLSAIAFVIAPRERLFFFGFVDIILLDYFIITNRSVN